MLRNPESWIAISFVLFVLLAFRPLRKAITGMLDDRAAKIRAQLDEAERLRQEAEAMLAEYQQRQHNALAEAEKIIAGAREEAARIRERGAADLEAALARREVQAIERIAQAETAALAEVRNLTVDIAIAASRRLLVEVMTPAQSAALVAAATTDLAKGLH